MGAGGFVQMFSSDVATVVCQTESEHSLCFSYIWVKMPRKNNGLFDVLNLLFLAAYCGQL